MWSLPAAHLRGQLLLVRASTVTSQQTRRVMLP
jgi:hypothetical protein